MNEQKRYSTEELFNIIRTRILTGVYLPNEKLSILNLMTEFNCSNMPIRECIKMLETDGLIYIIPKSGSYVKKLNAQDNKNAAEVRTYIEALSAKLVIEQETDVTELKMLFEKMEKILTTLPIDYPRYGDIHYSFHHKLVELSNNDICLQVYDRLNLRSSLHFYHVMTPSVIKRTRKEHATIVKMLEERNSKVEHFMIKHLWRKRTSFI